MLNTKQPDLNLLVPLHSCCRYDLHPDLGTMEQESKLKELARLNDSPDIPETDGKE
jgi:hypothetical protein